MYDDARPPRSADDAVESVPALPALEAPAPTQPSGPIDVNSAPPEAPRGLPGLYAITVDRIVAVRDERGGFTHLGELASVAGLDPGRREALRSKVVFGEFTRNKPRTYGRFLDL